MRLRACWRSAAVLGVVTAVLLLVIAATRYPGGYDWLHQTISSLFQPRTPSGLVNAARPLAVLSVFLFCFSGAVAFARIARRAATRPHQVTIRFAGIGSMGCAALAVTGLHDLVVGLAVLFFAVAILATFHLLWTGRRFGLMAAGVFCLVGTLGNTAMYYGEFLTGYIAVVQKVSLVAWALWLGALDLSYGKRPPRYARGDTLPEG